MNKCYFFLGTSQNPTSKEKYGGVGYLIEGITIFSREKTLSTLNFKYLYGRLL